MSLRHLVRPPGLESHTSGRTTSRGEDQARLDLTRYGHFTDRTIDFGPLVAGRPDLHVVYGPNETGKSTTLNALLDLLFGIEPQSGYGFMHDYASMEVRARIDVAGGSQEVVRVKKRVNSLLDPAGSPIDPAFLAAALQGLERGDYRMMFSLDDATLEEGGEAILSSKGDLGQVLFSATAGLAALHDTIASIRTDVDAFHKPRARSGELATLKARLEALKGRKNQIDTVASQHARLVAERAEARRALDAARDARVAARALATSRRDRLGALPHFARIASARGELEGLASLPEAPEDWSGELPALHREEVELATRVADVGSEIARLEGRLGHFTIDEAALSAAGEVGRLPRLRARHSDASEALPDARARLSAEGEAVAGLLRRLDQRGNVDPRELMLPAPVLAVLGDLMESRSGVVEALRKARLDVARGEAAVAGACEELGGRPAEADPAEMAMAKLIRSSSDAARAGGHDALAASAERAAARRRAQLSGALLGLRPWEGDLDVLAAMVTPAQADVEAWRNQLAEATAAAAEAADRVSGLEEDRTRLCAEAGAAAASAGWTPVDPAAARIDRERAWADHRSALDRATADAFERAMRADDAVTSARIGREGELSRLQQLRERVDGASAAIGRATASRDRAVARAAEVHARMAAAAAAAGGVWDGAATPAWLEGWLSRRSAALDLGAELAAAEEEARTAADAAEATQVTLARVLACADVPHDPAAGVDGLTTAAQSFLEEQAGLAGRRLRLAELQRDLSGLRRSLEQAEAGEDEWRASWARACQRCWFGSDVGTVEARALLDALAQLGPRLDERDRLTGEVRRLECDVSAFAAEVGRLAGLVPSVDATLPPIEASRLLEEAARTAVEARDGAAAAEGELEAARRRMRELTAAKGAFEARKRAMTSLMSVDTLAEVGERLASIARRRELRVRLDAAERDVVEALGTASLAEAEALLRDLDREELKAALAEAEARLDECERAEGEAEVAHRKAVDKLDEVGGDGEVARIVEERGTILLEIEERAAACLRLRLGAIAAEAAIDVFRDEHKSGLMTVASDAFATLTAGSYAKLTSRSERAGETLIAVHRTGGSRMATQLSKGTRFQLYLALRIAAHAEYLRARPSVPFLADDILETFDDQRAGESLRAFARMAEGGQVIYLTHHPHVCRIAAAVCPGVRIHELAPLPVA